MCVQGGLRTWEPTAGQRAHRVFRIIPRKSGCDAEVPGFSHVQPAHDAVSARRPGVDSPHLDGPAQIGIRASPPHAIYLRIYCGSRCRFTAIPGAAARPVPGARHSPGAGGPSDVGAGCAPDLGAALPDDPPHLVAAVPAGRHEPGVGQVDGAHPVTGVGPVPAEGHVPGHQAPDELLLVHLQHDEQVDPLPGALPAQ